MRLECLRSHIHWTHGSMSDSEMCLSSPSPYTILANHVLGSLVRRQSCEVWYCVGLQAVYSSTQLQQHQGIW